MRCSRFQSLIMAATASLLIPLSFIFLGASFTSTAHAQTMLTGALAGTVTDPSGAEVVGARVTATSEQTGAMSQTVSSSSGGFRFSLLKPGTYVLTISATGFKSTSTTVRVSLGQTANQNVKLAVGTASQTVEVSATSQLLQTDTAQLSSNVSLEELQNLPNPGSDLTYAAQGKPGVVMNTGADSSSGTLGYGNFAAFGLPGTSNNFTVNGMQVNDPFLNLNNSGPSNMLLGLNDVDETDVITNAYDVQYGSLAGVQMNMITRSGSNRFHGNLNYAWNGDSMNANDWFNKRSSPVVKRPFSNFNQWAAALGGPVKRNKLFFFANTEGITFITSSQNQVFLPSQTFESNPAYLTDPTPDNISVLGDDGNCSNESSSLFNANQSSQCAFYQHVFSIYNGTPNYANATPTDTPGQLQLSAPSRFSLTEKLITARVDMNITPNDKAFAHFKYDHGVQPTYTDPINSAFNAESDQPDYEGQFAETHTFGTKAVNQFSMAGSWYSAIFKNVDPAAEMKLFPMELTWYDGFANDLNNDGIYWPEGRNATQYQIGDDFSYMIGNHDLKAGFAFKKDDISDYDTGILTLPYVFTDAAYDDFQSGQSLLGVQNFTTNLNLPLSLYTLGFYFEDTWKPVPNATITAGIRVARNSNVSCPKDCLSNFGGSFFTKAASAPLNSFSGAYNQQIKYNLANAFNSYQPFMIEPRVGFTWSPGVASKTVVRGGFGVFTDVFPGTIADTMLDNPPLTTEFQILGSTFGGPAMPLQPSATGSYQDLASGANATFQSQFKTGGSAESMLEANPNYSVPSFTTVQGKLHYPTYFKWNLQIQREITQTQSVRIGYVGNRGYHEPNQNVGVNTYGGGYGTPDTAPAPSFGVVTQVESEATSNYNGLIVSWLFQGHGLNAQLNYAWSHALDEISNGGILPFNSGSIYSQINPYNLHDNYGNADYDIRHSFSGTYLYQMPYFGGPKVATKGWQVGGSIFANSGSPFTPSAYLGDFGIQNNFGNGAEVTPIAPAPGTPHHCSASAAKTPCLTAADFPNYLSQNAFGSIDRNQFWGPKYFDTDMTLQKAFDLPKMGDRGKFLAGLTAYNLFNHPNFGLPSSLIDSSHFGRSLYVEGPPTSIYGSGVGGDPSVRIVELTGKITF